jgi:hypothetical protein
MGDYDWRPLGEVEFEPLLVERWLLPRSHAGSDVLLLPSL